MKPNKALSAFLPMSLLACRRSRCQARRRWAFVFRCMASISGTSCLRSASFSRWALSLSIHGRRTAQFGMQDILTNGQKRFQLTCQPRLIVSPTGLAHFASGICERRKLSRPSHGLLFLFFGTLLSQIPFPKRVVTTLGRLIGSGSFVHTLQVKLLLIWRLRFYNSLRHHRLRAILML